MLKIIHISIILLIFGSHFAHSKESGDAAIKHFDNCKCYISIESKGLKPWELDFDNASTLRKQVSHCDCQVQIDLKKVENPLRYFDIGVIIGYETTNNYNKWICKKIARKTAQYYRIIYDDGMDKLLEYAKNEEKRFQVPKLIQNTSFSYAIELYNNLNREQPTSKMLKEEEIIEASNISCNKLDWSLYD
ncbi:MAG: hypothetical protein AB2696_18675 [Candidatus Thiodiazotropha sp.]